MVRVPVPTVGRDTILLAYVFYIKNLYSGHTEAVQMLFNPQVRRKKNMNITVPFINVTISRNIPIMSYDIHDIHRWGIRNLYF